MNKFSTRTIAITGITAAIYMVATLAISPLAYGSLQFRLSEVLVLLAFIDPIYGGGLILGCALSNLFSPLGLVDVVFGTFNTFCVVMAVSRSKSLFVASLWASIFSFIIGAEIAFIDHIPFLAATLSVMIGEFVVVTLMGYPIFKLILKNDKLMEILKLNKSYLEG